MPPLGEKRFVRQKLSGESKWIHMLPGPRYLSSGDLKMNELMVGQNSVSLQDFSPQVPLKDPLPGSSFQAESSPSYSVSIPLSTCQWRAMLFPSLYPLACLGLVAWLLMW